MFFPIVREKHIYVIVINLKKPAFEVLDNGEGDDFMGKYGPVFTPLVSLCFYFILFTSVIILFSNI